MINTSVLTQDGTVMLVSSEEKVKVGDRVDGLHYDRTGKIVIHTDFITSIIEEEEGAN